MCGSNFDLESNHDWYIRHVNHISSLNKLGEVQLYGQTDLRLRPLKGLLNPEYIYCVMKVKFKLKCDLNSIHNKIKFTHENEINNTINY